MERKSYRTQLPTWPAQGRHILAHHDDTTIVVYQAFKPQIADEAVRLGRFGPSFSRSRMSWIKPNFLWMMYRCGWATKVDQEQVLAIRLSRGFFDGLLRAAVITPFDPERHTSEAAWKVAVANSDVRLQWDPDHGPSGQPQRRRALQLGLRGKVVAEYADRAIVGLEDITPFVHAQREHARAPYQDLELPRERVYVPADPTIAAAIGLDSA